MMRVTPRRLAATISLVLAASSTMLPSSAAETPAAAPAEAAAPAASSYVSKPYTVPSRGISDAIKKAIASPDRTPEMTQRDGWRRPAEVLALANVKPGSRVVEFSPMGFYYTTLLSAVVGDKGTVHAYDMAFVEEQGAAAGKAFAEKHKNVQYQALDFNRIEFPRNVDVFFSVAAYHDMLLTGVDMDAFHSKVFKAMKPGAIYLVIDHAATHGTGTNDTGRLHRIDPGVLRAGIGSAGFELVEDSRILENTSDDHKWPIHQEGKRDQTDQAVYKFRKPIVY